MPYEDARFPRARGPDPSPTGPDSGAGSGQRGGQNLESRIAHESLRSLDQSAVDPLPWQRHRTTLTTVQGQLWQRPEPALKSGWLWRASVKDQSSQGHLMYSLACPRKAAYQISRLILGAPPPQTPRLGHCRPSDPPHAGGGGLPLPGSGSSPRMRRGVRGGGSPQAVEDCLGRARR